MPYTPELKRRFEADGYFVVEDAVDPAMLGELTAAVERVRDKVLAGAVDIYTHRSDNGEPWAIRGLFAPEFAEPIFADYLMDPAAMQYVEPFIGDDLRLGGTLIFTNPEAHDYGTGWHRDLGKENRDQSEAEELAILNRPLTRFKWHLALAPDSCLQLVPGTHRRYRTEIERRVLFETKHDDLPGQTTIRLQPGQSVFWSGSTIHRGVYPRGISRRTLVGVWEKYLPDEPRTEVDSRLKWMLADNVRGCLPEAMRTAYDRWRALQIVEEAPVGASSAMMG